VCVCYKMVDKGAVNMILCGKAKSLVFILSERVPLGQHTDKIWSIILETVI